MFAFFRFHGNLTKNCVAFLSCEYLQHRKRILQGHPHYDHIGLQLENIWRKSSSTGRNVVIVGHGNVALDCARILAKGGTKRQIPPANNMDADVTTSTASTTTTSGGLYDTDIATRAWNLLQEYPVSHISVVGRRGHVQASFTIKEVRELVNLEKEGYDLSFIVRNDELDMCTSTTATQEELNGSSGRPKTRIDTLLREAAAKGKQSCCC
jgi:adrenodoxin-NADP+ reductase